MKRTKHAIMACCYSKTAIVICIGLIILDIIAEIFFCQIVIDILLGTTTGLIATLFFFIYTRYFDSITAVQNIQHITTVFLDSSFDMIKKEESKEEILKHTISYQSQLSMLSYKVVYKRDVFTLLNKIDDFVHALQESSPNLNNKLTAIAEARDQMLD